MPAGFQPLERVDGGGEREILCSVAVNYRKVKKRYLFHKIERNFQNFNESMTTM